VLAELTDYEHIRSACGRKYQRKGNVAMRTAMTPFGLKFVEPLDTSFPAREVAGAVLCEQRQIAVFDGRPLGELMATEMVESRPTEKDGKDPINVDSDPFYD
jgi:putative ATP-grasp target RiPP